jgi:hypothetical protein
MVCIFIAMPKRRQHPRPPACQLGRLLHPKYRIHLEKQLYSFGKLINDFFHFYFIIHIALPFHWIPFVDFAIAESLFQDLNNCSGAANSLEPSYFLDFVDTFSP